MHLKIAENEGKLKTLSLSLAGIFKLKSVECEHAINKIMARIDANNPIRILGQGYSKLYNKDGISAGIDNIAVGDDITILTQGGKIGANVNNITKIKG